MISNLIRNCTDLMNQPTKVLWICLGIATASVLFDGSAIHLWSLHREENELARRIEESKVKLGQLAFQIQESQQPQFIERQARDQFDLVKDGDLVFVYAEDGTQEAEIE